MSSTQSCGSSSISKPAVGPLPMSTGLSSKGDPNQTKQVYFLEFVLGTRVHYIHMQHTYIIYILHIF